MPEPQRYVVGLVGASLATSLSPPLHEREADELGLRYVYQLLDIDVLGLAPADVGGLVAHARQLGFAGLNVTHPCKREVLAYLDGLSPEARALGAVNTVVFRDGHATGHNTDWSGFAEGFRRGLPGASLRDVVVLGAGGAGAAVAYALRALGAEHVVVADVVEERAERLAAALGGGIRAIAVAAVPDRLSSADGVVNASAVGMETHRTPVPPELLDARLWVADVVYRPLETDLLAHARRAGCRTLNGGGMVVFQAAASFALFTGREPDAERMYRHFRALTAEAGTS